MPKWVEKVITIPGTVTDLPTIHVTKSGQPEKSTKVQRLATDLWKSRLVCVECNGRWMSQLEERTKTLLSPLIQGHRVLLTQQEQLEIATWACMKAFLVDRDGQGHASESQRQAIYERREPPTDMVVLLAAFNEPTTLAIFTPHAEGTGSQGQPLAQWVTSFMIGHLVVQVFGRTGSVLKSVIESAPGGVSDERSFTVWPVQANAVEWPPRVTLERSDFPDFLTRIVPTLDGAVESFLPIPICGKCGVAHDPITSTLPIKP